MNISLSKVLGSGMRFYHEYDFGTTTALVIKVVSEQEGAMGGRSIRLLARNEPPPPRRVFGEVTIGRKSDEA